MPLAGSSGCAIAVRFLGTTSVSLNYFSGISKREHAGRLPEDLEEQPFVDAGRRAKARR